VRLVLPLLAVLCLGWTSPWEFVVALELQDEEVTGAAFTEGDEGMFDVLAALGVIQPPITPTMCLLTTGQADNITQAEDFDWPGSGGDTSAGDLAEFQVVLTAPVWARSIEVTWYFLSREYPEWVGSNYNDTFELHVASEIWTGNAAYDALGNPVTVNSALFVVTSPTDLQGTGFDNDGGTGWVTTRLPCQPLDELSLTFTIYDVLDGVWDSAVLVDSVLFSEEWIAGPWTDPRGDDDDVGDDDDDIDDDDDDDDDDTVLPDDDDIDDDDIDDELDSDGDGSPDRLDCEDDDPTIHPGAEEVCGDGIDQDCDQAESTGAEDPDCWTRSCFASEGAPTRSALPLVALPLAALGLRRRRGGTGPAGSGSRESPPR
jgi:hypothetical protein